jgi:hypothetical protein
LQPGPGGGLDAEADAGRDRGPAADRVGDAGAGDAGPGGGALVQERLAAGQESDTQER